MLANRHDDSLGFYLVSIDEHDVSNFVFLMKWNNKLNIRDTNMAVLLNEDRGYKELVVTYKVIYLNIFNIMVLDLSSEGIHRLIFRHESSQLWESECCGFLLQEQKDFIKLSKNGMSMLTLTDEDHKSLKDSNGNDMKVHSIESFNYLKINKENYILLECIKPEERIICVSQEYLKSQGGVVFN